MASRGRGARTSESSRATEGRRERTAGALAVPKNGLRDIEGGSRGISRSGTEAGGGGWVGPPYDTEAKKRFYADGGRRAAPPGPPRMLTQTFLTDFEREF